MPDSEVAAAIRDIRIAIDKRNSLSGAVISDDELEQQMTMVLFILIPAIARIAGPLVHHFAAKQMAIAGTGKQRPTAEEIRDALKEPEKFRRFYPEAMRAGSRAMINILRPFWPPKLADILEASLNDLEEGQLSKMLTPVERGPWQGSLPDRKRFVLCLASEVAFQQAANPNFSGDRVVRMVTGQTREGYDPDAGLPPLIPLPFIKWETITNTKSGLLAFGRKHFSHELGEAAAAGVASGSMGAAGRTDFGRFRDQYLQTTPEGWKAMWARVTGKNPVRASKSRKA